MIAAGNLQPVANIPARFVESYFPARLHFA